LILKKKNQLLYRYDVHIEPSEGLSKKKIRRYLELLLKQDIFKRVETATDYRSILIANANLNLTGNEATFRIVWYDEIEEPFPPATAGEAPELTAERRRRLRTLKVKYVNSLSIQELYTYVNAEQEGIYSARGDLVQALNIIFGRAPNFDQTIANVGQNKFYPFTNGFKTVANVESVELTGGLVALRGYYSSVRLAPRRVLVNLNVLAGAFYKPGKLHELMEQFMAGKSTRDVRNLRELSAFIKGLKVFTTYFKEKNAEGVEHAPRKVKSVLGLVHDPHIGANCRQVEFRWTNKKGDKEQINVEQYFIRSKSFSSR
jgi:eukaryotic translation initiation factor 2C